MIRATTGHGCVKKTSKNKNFFPRVKQLKSIYSEAVARWHIHRDQRGKVCQRAGIGHTPEGQSTRITGLGFMTR